MAETTKIQWADATLNPWRGCQKVAPGCVNCYADTLSKRNPAVLGVWGPNGTRVRASEKQWREPLKWDQAAEQECRRWRVFVASLADVFEDWRGAISSHVIETDEDGERFQSVLWYGQDWRNGNRMRYFRGGELPASGTAGDWSIRTATMDDMRADLFRLFAGTPHLDKLVLTKRPQNIRDMIQRTVGVSYWRECIRPSTWLLASVSEQDTLNRNGELIAECADLAAVTGLSAEPLLGPLDLTSLVIDRNYGTAKYNVLTGQTRDWHDAPLSRQGKVNWIIAGGESGHGARPFDVAWLDLIIHHCRTFETALFVKQLGANVYDNSPVSRCRWPGGTRFQQTDAGCRVLLNDPKGGDPDEWPEDFRIRQFPEGRNQP